jgi:hypothetical protein
MLPLRLEVFAKGAVEPVLRFGFDSISYESIDPSLYEFAAPDGAEVTTEVIDPEKARAESGDTGGPSHGEADKAERAKVARRALLTVDQAQELVGYELARARDYDARAFRWAYVFSAGGPLTAAGDPLFAMAGVKQPASTEPSSVLLYGSGFGAITLAQTKTTAELTKQLEQLPVLGQATADGATVRSVFTPLGGVVIWQQDGTTLLAGGMVTQADLEAFVRTVR